MTRAAKLAQEPFLNKPGTQTDPVTESDFSSFDDALKKLELEEEDLKRLISAGEIRAFREGSNMRLRVEDVSKVADQLGIGGSVAEEDAGELLEVEDLVLDELDDAVEELEVAADEPAKAAPRRSSGRAAAAAAGPEAADEGNGMRAALIFTCVLMIFGIPFAIDMVNGTASGVTASVVDMLSGK
jgi:prefoldin subunit 5